MLKPPVEMSGTTHRADQGVQICGANRKNFKCCSLRTVGGDESVEVQRGGGDTRMYADGPCSRSRIYVRGIRSDL